MAHTILFPITRYNVDDAIAVAPEVARQARAQGATVVLLQTECLHGLFTDVDDDYVEVESRGIMAATERVAAALVEHGAIVQTVWECVQVPRRPVDLDTARRHEADAVFVVHQGGLAGLFETLALHRLRRHGIAVLRPEQAAAPVG